MGPTQGRPKKASCESATPSASSMAKQALKPGFYSIELHKTDWTLPERYSDLHPIGTGAFGQVCSAQDAETGRRVAVKKLSRPFQTLIHAQRAYREVRILRHLRHDNVIRLLNVFTPATSEVDTDDVYLVTELMTCDLAAVIRNQRYQMAAGGRAKMTDNHVQFYVYQTLRALKYVHSANIIHRDLKPSNLAINEDNELRILDFGLARQSDAMMSGYVTTRWYRAPEVLLSWMEYDHTVDIWSVGCIMAELLTGEVLFPGKDALHQLSVTMELTGKPSPALLSKLSSKDAQDYINKQEVQQRQDFEEHFRGCSAEAIDLLRHMLELDPALRYTATQALAHPYLQKYADPEDEPSCPSKFKDDTASLKDISVPQWKSLVFEAIQNFVELPPEDTELEP